MLTLFLMKHISLGEKLIKMVINGVKFYIRSLLSYVELYADKSE